MKKETDMPPSTEETASIAESAEEVSENREQGGEPPDGGGPAVIDDSAADDETISRRRKVVGIGLIGLGLVFLAYQFFDLGDYLRLWPLALVVMGLSPCFLTPGRWFVTPGRLIFGLILVIGGLSALGANLGFFTWADAAQLVRLWPLFLIVAGVNMLLGRRRQTTAVVISLLILVAGVGFLAIAHDTEWGPFAQAARQSQMIEGPDTEPFVGGTLLLDAGALDLSVRGTDSPYMAIGDFQSHRTPLISEYTESHEYHLKITQKDNPVWLPIGLGELRGDSLSLSLSRDVRWSIDMNLGAADAKLDLRDLTLADLTLDSGASKVDLTLGPHVAEGAEVVVKGGAGSYQISLPKELDLSVRIDTALTSKNMDPALEDQGSGEYTHDGGGPPLRVRISAGVSSVRVNLY